RKRQVTVQKTAGKNLPINNREEKDNNNDQNVVDRQEENLPTIRITTKERMKVKQLLVWAVSGLLLTACSEAPYYEEVVSFDGNEWTQKQKPEFTVEIDDTTAVYSFVLTLRTTTEYAYNNLWIFWNTQTPDGEKVREPFELLITNPDGTWIGKNSGTIVENQ